MPLDIERARVLALLLRVDQSPEWIEQILVGLNEMPGLFNRHPRFLRHMKNPFQQVRRSIAVLQIEGIVFRFMDQLKGLGMVDPRTPAIAILRSD
jgi:hypothetical protein